LEADQAQQKRYTDKYKPVEEHRKRELNQETNDKETEYCE